MSTQVTLATAVDPRRSLVGRSNAEKKAPAAQTPAATQPASDNRVEEPRIAEQKRIAQAMLSQLGQDAKIATIMLNPVFLPHAQAIAWQATARAISRYENEVPRKDFDALMNEEQGKARQAILDLPRRYGQAISEAVDTTGDAISDAAEATGNAIVDGANAVADGAQTVGNAVVDGTKTAGRYVGEGLLGGFGLLVMGVRGIGHGIGAGLSGLGNLLSGAGDALKKATDE
jgi:hypothetical protein